jgi:hypothetical protein
MARSITVIEAVSSASQEIGIAQGPVTSVVASSDQDIVQMGALLSAVADELMITEPYQVDLADGFWLADADGNKKQAFTADTDLILFDSRLAIDGLKFRFLKAKGLEFGEELRDFSNRLNRLAARTNAAVIDLYLDAGRVL